MATYNLRDGIPSRIKAGDVLNYPYMKNLSVYGGSITLGLPKGRYLLEVWGSCAGERSNVGGGIVSISGGTGGYAKGTLELRQKTDAILTAGGPGFNGAMSVTSAGGAGGASDVRLIQNTVNHRVIVAGGGGWNGYAIEIYNGDVISAGGASGGFGGGSVGQSGGYEASTANPAGGGTQSAGGANGESTAGRPAGTNGTFGMGGYGTDSDGVGGGGWYGGGAGGHQRWSHSIGDIWEDYGSGGGGSGFVYSEDTQVYVPSSYALTSLHWLTDTENISGHEEGKKITGPDGALEVGHQSGGYVRITILDIFNGFYIGNSSGKAAAIKGIYIGDSNGKARRVVKGYIGDSNGKAKRFL